ncbi:hypothetical protein MDAP_000443 [Mitosporidium daphniae]|uniref:RNA-binding protein n=1 Tax=Mitosporidium daphniae TaxID=1485682 RepID=A0A098VTF3_9MICR|nr:RNA-binding protein [Mitosporidium daphniae]KGG52104.1 RNA-binding protein [Mitosporidium daphniae]|eukprot:XP_013238531.1 RNA-binding protein [Mitosporidium daphniae]
MVKQRFTTLDVHAMSKELKYTLFPCSSSPYRVQNVYQLSQKAFVLKLTRSDAISSLDDKLHPPKVFLLLESGIRFHPTVYDISFKSLSSALAPSAFLVKLRQYIKGKRMTSLEQLGNDRVIRMIFGVGEEYEFKIYFELYSSGNVIITDAGDRILALLRIVETEKLSINVNMAYRQYASHLQDSDVEASLAKALASCSNPKKLVSLSPFFKGSTILAQEAISLYTSGNRDIKSVIAKISSYEDSFSGHILRSDSGSLQEYSPVPFPLMEGSFVVDKHPSFAACVDFFYATIESELAAERERNLKATAEQRKAAVRETLDMRIVELKSSEADAFEKALAIEENEDLVNAALWAIQSALATGMSWDEVFILVKKEKEKGNSVACIIDSLDFYRNSMKVLLPCSSSSSSSLMLTISLELSLSARANAQWWYNERRAIASKCEKTVEAQSKAIASSLRKIDFDLKEALSKLPNSIDKTPMRKIMWFEKFSWFISSDNILVVAGTNSSQNELVVKKYMGSRDIYLHAELQGSPSVLIKCPVGEAEDQWNAPPATLSQAASMAVCLSSAWTCNIVTSAYWVYSSQVSKSPPTGLYLTPGSFMIYGKKNFIAPSQLVYGFGFLFKLGDSESIERHRQITLAKDAAQQELPSTRCYSADAILDPEFLKNEEIRIARVSKVIEERGLNKTTPKTTQKKESKKKSTNQNETKSSKVDSKKDVVVPLHSVRGTRGKLKKIKKKYQQQDIEEALARMEILGTQDAERHLQRRFPVKNTNISADVVDDTSVIGASLSTEAADPHETTKSINMQDQVIRLCEDEEVPRDTYAGVDDGLDVHSDEESYSDEIISTSIIESFTGNPRPEDVLSYSIAVCGPWSSIQNLACSVKLTPGNLKKGKAVKTATSICLSQTSHEKDKDLAKRMYSLIKKIKEETMINIMIQNCKVAGPTQVLQKIQKAQKKSIKQKAKERQPGSKK